MRVRHFLLILIAVLSLNFLLAAQVKDFNPVTDAMLRNPAPGDWLNWRGTDNAWGYSTLDQINRQNVQQLQLVWSWAMDDAGANEATPLVHDGIMYLPNPAGVIQALDGATGDLLWEYRPAQGSASQATAAPTGGVTRVDPGKGSYEQTDIPRLSQRPVSIANGDEGRAIQRNVAIYGDRIFATTNDAHVIALDARTGKLLWDTTVADHKMGYEYTSGPIVVRGKVVAGITGCTRYKAELCFITGHDAATGKELWRTSTIARPGEPGGDTWGNLPLAFRAGGDAWIPGSYDPETNLIYWGTAQAKPWVRAVRGTDGDALYTDSTLALDPDSGKIKWYYQHIPGETQDMDEVFEHVLIDTGGHKSLFEMGKLGILWELDRTTGQFIHLNDLGYQNIVQVNPKTGKVTYYPDKIPQVGVEVDFCPSTSGFKSWRAMAFSPQTNAMYIPLTLNCEKATFGPGPEEKVIGGGGPGPVRRKNYKFPGSGGNLGEFLAMDINSGKILWRHRTASPSNAAALTTAGGLVFGGDWDRHVYAYDAATGKILWQSRLPTSAQGFPITYLAKGKQYVALPAGIGGGSWSTLIAPELDSGIRRPNTGNTMLVFALPSNIAAPAASTSGRDRPREASVSASHTVWEGVYSDEQAKRGLTEYLQTCASCHSENLRGVGPAPSLIGEGFSLQWDGLTVGDLFGRIRAMMPANRPNSLPSQSYRDIVAFILQSNKFPAGGNDLDADQEELRQILISTKRPEINH